MIQIISTSKIKKQLSYIEIINLTKSIQSKILKLKNYCKKKGLKFYLSNNIKIAIKLRLDGAYIPSFNKDFNHLNYSYHRHILKLLDRLTILKKLKLKELQQVDKNFFVFFI